MVQWLELHASTAGAQVQSTHTHTHTHAHAHTHRNVKRCQYFVVRSSGFLWGLFVFVFLATEQAGS